MIDPDIRDMIAPELQGGEELLWAEKIDRDKRMKWAEYEVQSNKTNMIIFALLFCVCLAVNYFDFDGRLVVLAILSLLMCLFFAAAVLDREGRRNSALKRRIHFGYALSNYRLFFLDQSLQLAEFFDAKDIKWAKPYNKIRNWKWGTSHLMLAPIGTGLLKFAELYFLRDFVKSETHINNAIREKTS